jgi:hypothetical protein
VGVLSTSELFPGHAQLGGALLVGQKKKRWYLSIKGPGQTGHPGGGTDGPGHRPYLIMHAAVCQKRLLRRRGCLVGGARCPHPTARADQHEGAIGGLLPVVDTAQLLVVVGRNSAAADAACAPAGGR